MSHWYLIMGRCFPYKFLLESVLVLVTLVKCSGISVFVPKWNFLKLFKSRVFLSGTFSLRWTRNQSSIPFLPGYLVVCNFAARSLNFTGSENSGMIKVLLIQFHPRGIDTIYMIFVATPIECFSIRTIACHGV